jgi:hypothetical protein
MTKLKVHWSLPDARHAGWEKDHVDNEGRETVLLQLAYKLYFMGLIEITKLPDLSNSRVEFVATINLPKEMLSNEVHPNTDHSRVRSSQGRQDGSPDREGNRDETLLGELLSARFSESISYQVSEEGIPACAHDPSHPHDPGCAHHDHENPSPSDPDPSDSGSSGS